MQTYHLRITSGRDETCERTIEFSAKQSLLDVHIAIQEAFELDDDHLWAFYPGGGWFERDSEISDERAAETPLYSLGLEVGDLFCYVFDFGEELRHAIEVVGIGEVNSAFRYPRLIDGKGKPPAQYPGCDDEFDDDEDEEQVDDGKTLTANSSGLATPSAGVESETPSVQDIEPFSEQLVYRVRDVLKQWNEFEYCGPSSVPLAQSEGWVAVAEEVVEACPTGSRFDQLNAQVDDEVGYWLETTLDVCEAQFGPQRSIGLLQTIAYWTDSHRYRIKLAMAFAEAGQRSEALDVLPKPDPFSGPGPDEMKAVRAEVLMADQAYDEAEKLLRAVRQRSWLSRQARTGATEALERLLLQTDRMDEAREVVREAVSRRDRAWEAERGTFRRTSSKVGRNDPCPCGSGKKYKKCCL